MCGMFQKSKKHDIVGIKLKVKTDFFSTKFN